MTQTTTTTRRRAPSTVPSLLLLLLLSTGCRRDAAGDRAIVETARAVDGIPIAYDLRGRGSIGLVFVHGWACDRLFWREQLDAFAKDYRVAAIDLPGHGESGAERKEWSVRALGGDVQTVVEKLNLPRVILIGHSMGGPVCLEAARRMPGRVIAVIGVDTLHNAEFMMPPELVQMLVERYQADYEGTMRESVKGMFSKGTDASRIDWVVKRGCLANRKAVLALLSDFGELDSSKFMSEAKVPIRCINAGHQSGSRFPTDVETNRKYCDYDAVLIEGVGHFPMLEKPVEFNARLRETLAKLAPRQGLEGDLRP